MRIFILLVFVAATLVSCWKYNSPSGPGTLPPTPAPPRTKVMGYKPVYGAEPIAKKVLYTSTPQPVMVAGNIYAFQNYIFQLDQGRGIHVIDNSVPADAHRIGFITVKGCSQISIKDDKIYTNSYDDLVVLEFSNLNDVQEYGRLKAVFPEYRYQSPMSEPPHTGYFECPRFDSFVVAWVQDSIYQSCYKY